jgi:hypothetical protein
MGNRGKYFWPLNALTALTGCDRMTGTTNNSVTSCMCNTGLLGFPKQAVHGDGSGFELERFEEELRHV